LPDLQPHSPAMGQKDGEKWTAAADLQPTTSKSDGLLDALIDRCGSDAVPDPLTWRRLKKRRLVLRDALERLERELQPQEPA